MTDVEFERHALAILGLARFLRVYRAGGGDYTCDRHVWLGAATVEDIMADVGRISKG